MKKIFIVIGIVVMLTLLFSPFVIAVQSVGIRGKVEYVDSNSVTVDKKTYRFNKQIRVVLITRDGIHMYERIAHLSSIRVGDKVFAVVNYDEMMDIHLERY